ncbi:Alpha/Beta hydrolase protein [Trametes gibbosa]|nr:Alpha/Beta hydrolase protein [Trametes gibbosa]
MTSGGIAVRPTVMSLASDSDPASVLDLSYGPLPAHAFDYHHPSDPPPLRPLLVFVHGGAWRSEDKAHHAPLARALAQLTACPVAIPNYRLTTTADPIQHPSHAQDILLFLHFLLTWTGPFPSSPHPPAAKLFLLGHSCSAHMLASIFLTSPYPELKPSRQLLAATTGIILSEGIYDIDAILHSFPGYKDWFIANAFGPHDTYTHVNVASYPARTDSEHIRWLIIHSKGDTLVDILQSQIMYAHLTGLAGGLPRPSVEKTFDELDQDHNDILRGSVYPRIVADFVAQDIASVQSESIPPSAR